LTVKREPNARHPGPAQLDDRQRETRIDALDVECLADLSIADLRKLWLRHMGRASPPAQKRLLIRELAWRAQERVHGGLDVETRRLLSRAVRAAMSGDPPDEAVEDENGVQMPTAKRQARGTASTVRVPESDLTPGTRISRVWQGVRYEVCVLDGGRFRLAGRDQIYSSLSEIAREITGTRWSGPRFFGLTTREGSGADQPESGKKRSQGRDGGDS
jgi:hypothetical protein